jgi:hypothetical protein
VRDEYVAEPFLDAALRYGPLYAISYIEDLVMALGRDGQLDGWHSELDIYSSPARQ